MGQLFSLLQANYPAATPKSTQPHRTLQIITHVQLQTLISATLTYNESLLINAALRTNKIHPSHF